MTALEPKTNFRPSTMLSGHEMDTSTSREATSLTQAVKASGCAFDKRMLRLVARRDAGLAFQPRAILALLSYCYARGTYGSQDVEDLLQRDATFCNLCPDEFPGARLIRRFRRENREAISVCLQAALRFLAEHKVKEGTVTKVSETQLAEEASRRIIMAMFIDNMELNGD